MAKWSAQGVIEARQERHVLNNNIVFAAKKDGRVRVCNDCTPVNAVTEDYDWPLPRLQDLRFKITGSRWFTRLDLKDAFFRIRVPNEFRHYTAFTSRGVQYQFRRMPFGVKTGPAVFQQFMDTRLARHLVYVVVYIDDILIHAPTLAILRKYASRVRRDLLAAGCTINEDKSEYDKQQLLFAGLMIHADGTSPNKDQIDKLLLTPVPVGKQAMQSALGLVSYLRDFIPLVSHFSSTLYPKKNSPPLEAAEVTKLWNSLLRHVASAVTSLRHWNDNADADLYCDASGHGIGVVLVQDNRITAVASRKLTPAETRYSATDREHLALVYAAQKFRMLIHRWGAETRVHSDHAALLGRNVDIMTPRQVRWFQLTSQWIPRLRHVPGAINPADFFSRWAVGMNGGVEKI